MDSEFCNQLGISQDLFMKLEADKMALLKVGSYSLKQKCNEPELKCVLFSRPVRHATLSNDGHNCVAHRISNMLAKKFEIRVLRETFGLKPLNGWGWYLIFSAWFMEKVV